VSSSECSRPEVGQPLHSVPVLALISSRTLDFRESKGLFRGHASLMGIDNY
jgi:hypothetical protein